MYILGIESTCDETAVSVVKDGRQILSNEVASQVEEHKLYGGVVPEIASRRHVEAISSLYNMALEHAGITLDQLDAIAVTYAPGLIGCVLVGLNFAKGLAYAAGKPLVPVHHLRGHIASNYLKYPDLKPPFLALVVSGGHSHIVQVESYTKYRVIGRTRDDAAGEAFDKSARTLGFDYPGGKHLDAAAKLGDKNAYHFPKPHLDTPYDFSFSGLKTAVINLKHTADQRGETLNINDVCASFQNTVVSILAEKTIAAAKELGENKIVLAGGVSANSGLRAMLQQQCDQLGWQLFVPPVELCGDNAAMIASQGYYEFLAGQVADLSLNAYASLPIDCNFDMAGR